MHHIPVSIIFSSPNISQFSPSFTQEHTIVLTHPSSLTHSFTLSFLPSPLFIPPNLNLYSARHSASHSLYTKITRPSCHLHLTTITHPDLLPFTSFHSFHYLLTYSRRLSLSRCIINSITLHSHLPTLTYLPTNLPTYLPICQPFHQPHHLTLVLAI